MDLGVRLGGLYDVLGTWPASFLGSTYGFRYIFLFLSFVDTLWTLCFSLLSCAPNVMWFRRLLEVFPSGFVVLAVRSRMAGKRSAGVLGGTTLWHLGCGQV